MSQSKCDIERSTPKNYFVVLKTIMIYSCIFFCPAISFNANSTHTFHTSSLFHTHTPTHTDKDTSMHTYKNISTHLKGIRKCSLKSYNINHLQALLLLRALLSWTWTTFHSLKELQHNTFRYDESIYL